MTRSKTRVLLAGTALVLVLAAALPANATGSANTVGAQPNWRPTASEKLVKLPAGYLKKTLDYDFAQSELGQALKDLDIEIGLKTQTLGDLQAATERADGDLLTELRHQFLAEKRAYLDLVERKHDLKRKHLKTKVRLMEKVLDRMGRRRGGMTKARVALVGKQEAARQRFKASLDGVDVKVMNISAVPESRYAKEYAKNLGAIERLVSAIERHSSASHTAADGQPLSKEDHIRQIIADGEAEIALLDQQDKILGYMAKLVALDAMALSEDVMDAEMSDSDVPSVDGVTTAVGFFVD